MTETPTPPDDNEAKANREDNRLSKPLRLWPAVVIVLVHLAVTLGTASMASTNLQGIVGFGAAPVVAALLLACWWILSTGVRLRDRLAGLALSGLAIVLMIFAHGQNFMFLLVIALPVFTTGSIALLCLTQNLPWPTRRWIAAGGIALWVVGFGMLRVEAIGGDLVPILSWRWSPAPAVSVACLENPAGRAELPTTPELTDWPGFRGPNRDGVVADTVFATDWNATPPVELWRRPVGVAWSSVTIVGDYLFTQEQCRRDELIVCYQADSGEVVWVSRIEARFADVMGDGPRATPTFDRGKIYAQGATGYVLCLDAATGETLWQRDLRKDAGAQMPMWGFASSPLITHDKVIVFTGAANGESVIAYNKDTGDVEWTAGDGNHGYSSGQITEFAGTPQVLMNSNFGLQSFEPNSGHLLWEHHWDLGANARIVQPAFDSENGVLIGTSFGKGTRLLRIDKSDEEWQVNEEWTTKRFRPYFNDFVVHEGYCYGFDGNRLACIDAATGERQWTGDRYGGQVVLLRDMDMLLLLSEKGNVVLVEAQPGAFHEVARMKSLHGKTWNHPVVAGVRLYVRNAEEMVCYQLPASDSGR